MLILCLKRKLLGLSPWALLQVWWDLTLNKTSRIFSLNSACFPGIHALHIATYILEHLDPRDFTTVISSPMFYSFLSCVFYGCANWSEATVSSQCITQNSVETLKSTYKKICLLVGIWSALCFSWRITPESLLQLLGDRFLIVMQSLHQCSIWVDPFSYEVWETSAASFMQGCLDA